MSLVLKPASPLAITDYLHPLVPFPTNPISGRYYQHPVNMNTLTTSAHPASTIRAVPFIVPAGLLTPISLVGVENSGTGSGQLRVGLYAGEITTFQPTTFLGELGTSGGQSVATAGRKVFGFNGIATPPGLYYLAVWTSVSVSLRYGDGGLPGIAGIGAPSTQSLSSCYVQTGVTTPWPDPLVPNGNFSACPRLDFQF